MNVIDLKQDIKNKNLKPIYVFTGEEMAIAKIYAHKIADISGLEIRVSDSVRDIFDNLKRKSLLSKSYCYIIPEDYDFVTSDELWTVFDLIENDIVIILLNSLDKRLKFVKQYKDIIVEFNALTEQILTKYTKAEIDLTDSHCNDLISLCENSYGRILLECDKIKHYSNSIGCNVNDGFEILKKSGVINSLPYDSIFDFCDAVLIRDIDKSIRLLKCCYEYGENSMVLLSVLYNNFKHMLQVQSCDSNNISNSTGINPYVVKQMLSKMGKYSISELVRALKLLHDTEHNLKFGKIPEEYCVYYVLLNIL